MEPNVRVATLLALVLTVANALGQNLVRTDELHRLQNNFLVVLRERDTARFLSFIGTRGVSFGVDGKIQLRKEIANEFRVKSGDYCLLFDSACLTHAWNMARSHSQRSHRFCSVYELLTDKAVEVETSVGSYEGKPQTCVWITPHEVQSCSNSTEPVEFIFTRFKDGWKLIAVQY